MGWQDIRLPANPGETCSLHPLRGVTTMKRWFRFSRSAVLLAALALSAAGSLAAGCNDTGGAPSGESDGVENVLITSDTVASSNGTVHVNLGEKIRYFFDFRQPIDFDRVLVVSAGGMGKLSDGIAA